MKHTIIRILSCILYPLRCCRQILLDAPIICCDNAPLGFSAAKPYARPEDSGCACFRSSAVRSDDREDCGWYRHAG